MDMQFRGFEGQNGGETLTAARLKIKKAGHKFEGQKMSVWLDVKKTRAELKPARLTHRAAECLTHIASSKEHKPAITKISSGNLWPQAVLA